ncbi:ABC-three component system protein [Acinetobacter dispersus]|uniref:ABC-three component system protein n=1 Tax=Acinetobacter dispersus TaxID=70348 RepID=UPI001F4A8F16|nr:ABC-three component system protein [Acinetobacter dispersus]MCH7391472.1 hypothetical protein [Acinetobacter dispersus]
MAEDVKSSLHDAVPSWNGFNYQGKVGLYVCLKNILEKLTSSDINSVEFNNFLDSYSIEYEWIEDFSIKNNESYISLHQVKHKEGTSFSSHISAIVTILNRKLCRLSETDFIKYIKLNYDYADCVDDDAKKEKKYKVIKDKLDEVIQAGYLDAEYRLVKDWKSIKNEIENIDRSDLERLLNDFESFTNNAFSASKVYFHTAEKVTSPRNELHLYEGMPDHHKSTVNGLKSLSTLNIFLGFDTQNEYTLEMSDSEILSEIDYLILEILKKTQPEETFITDQILLYQALLLKIIDSHIVKRHKNIRDKKDQGKGFLETRDVIKYSEFIAPLKILFTKQDSEYWEGFCMRIFEDACLEEIEKIESFINNGINVELNKNKKIKLEKYRSVVFNGEKIGYADLFIRLSPHIKKRNACAFFYNEIANKDVIRDTFLYFIQSINKEHSGFIIKTGDKVFHPSTISFANKQEDEWEYYVTRCLHGIQENNIKFLDATHLLAKTASEHVITNRFIKVNTLVEAIYEGENVESKNEITNINGVRFMSLKDALKEINNA